MKVRGTAYWASVQAPNTTYDPVYCIDLAVSDNAAESLKKLGLKVKKTDDGLICKFKRPQFRKDGSENKKPTVRDANNNDFEGLIGNGSDVIVQFSTFEWQNNFGSGVSSDLQGVQVLDLVSFRPGDGEEFEAVDGDKVGDDVITEQPKPAAPKAAEFDDDLPDVL